MTPIAHLRGLLERAAADRADAEAIVEAAGAVFATFKRTDMRSGVANMIRRLAQLDVAGAQPIEADGWRVLLGAAALLERADVGPADVRALDDRLREIGLDVDRPLHNQPHQPGPQHPN